LVLQRPVFFETPLFLKDRNMSEQPPGMCLFGADQRRSAVLNQATAVAILEPITIVRGVTVG